MIDHTHRTDNFPSIATTIKRRHFRSNDDLLCYFYQDITRLQEVASPYMSLRVEGKERTVLRGIKKAQARMEALKEATGGTLFMDVEMMVTGRTAGIAVGLMRAQRPGLQDLAERFVGIWAFVDGVVVHYSESTPDSPDRLDKWLWHAKYPLGNDIRSIDTSSEPEIEPVSLRELDTR